MIKCHAVFYRQIVLWLHVYLLLAELCLPSCTLLTDHSTMTCTNRLTALCTDLAVWAKYTDRRLTVFFISNRPIFSETSLKWQRLQQWECDTSIPLNSAFRNSHTLSMAILCPMPPRRLTVRLWIASSAKDEAHQPEIPEQTVNVFFQSVTDMKHLVVSVRVHLHDLTIGSTVDPIDGSTVEPTGRSDSCADINVLTYILTYLLLDFTVQGKIDRGRHTDQPAGCHSIQTNKCQPPPSPIFLQARCPRSVKALKAKALTHLLTYLLNDVTTSLGNV